MNNIQYEALLRAKLIELGIDSMYLDAYIDNIIKTANATNINIMQLIEDGITKEMLASPSFNNMLNEVRKNTSFIHLRKYNPEPNYFIKRNIIL